MPSTYSITNLKADVEGALHGTTVNQINNLFGLFDRAARDFLLDVDPQETIRIVETDGPVYNGIWDYPIPSDLKGNRIIDIRPQFKRNASDVWLQNYNQAFDLLKNNTMTLAPDFTIQFNTSTKSLRINSPNLISGITINTASTTDGNGTWTVGGDASNLTVDNQNWIVDGGALELDLDLGGSSGYVENSTMTGINLEANLNQATQFLYSYFPTASAISSVKLRFGSSSSDYYEVSATMTQEGTVFQNAWNLLAYPWLGATVVGSPDPSDITYVRVTWDYDGTAQTGIRLNGIQSIMGRVLELEYYSNCLFRDAVTGAYSPTVEDDSDLINLDVESYQIYFNRVMYLVSQQVQGSNMVADMAFFKGEYDRGVARYVGLYKSQVQKPQSQYYVGQQGGYSQYFGSRWFGG